MQFKLVLKMTYKFLQIYMQLIPSDFFHEAQTTFGKPLALFAHAIDTHLQTSLRPMPSVPWERDVSAQHRQSGISFAFKALICIAHHYPPVAFQNSH